MAEYIRREDVLSIINASIFDLEYNSENIALQEAIKLIPTADVVEVVRCKDCIHRPSRIHGAEDECEGLNLEFPDDWCPMQCEDGWYNKMPRDDYFCAYGEET